MPLHDRQEHDVQKLRRVYVKYVPAILIGEKRDGRCSSRSEGAVTENIKGGSIVEIRRDSQTSLSTRIPAQASYRCVGLRLLRRCTWTERQ